MLLVAMQLESTHYLVATHFHYGERETWARYTGIGEKVMDNTVKTLPATMAFVWGLSVSIIKWPKLFPACSHTKNTKTRQKSHSKIARSLMVQLGEWGIL